ncbi:uncharacterized protein LOC127837321 [Dreissena polymorpha]|uniref:uncharacterized protein LOC127837321 n=1 Tax=Dreissena polymorpha TaxID=45954 RepID=UPI002263D80D|nr:uncharacterized protein LOC127837321 [Dreissena polymorpha]
MRKKLNAALDELEKTTLKELDEIRTTLQTALKEDVENCSRLKDELKQLSNAVNVLCDKSNKEIEFIASRKCLEKIKESESYLKKKSVKVQSSIIFTANSNIDKYLSQQSSLGRIVDSMQSLKMSPDQVMTVRRKSEFIIRISSDTSYLCNITGICCLPNGQVIVVDFNNKKVKLLDRHYNVSSHCDVPGNPWDICQITSSEVAVTYDKNVQFISVRNWKLKKGRKFLLPHDAFGIAYHEGALYVTSSIVLYQYALSGSLVKKIYEDASSYCSVWKCAVSPAGDRIYVLNNTQHKVITLAIDGTLISTFVPALLSPFDVPELQSPYGVHVTSSGHVLVCGFGSKNVIQLDTEGRKKLATLVSLTDTMCGPMSVCYNMNTHQIIVGLDKNNQINVMELQ